MAKTPARAPVARPTVADLLAAVDGIAPFSIAAEWDNVGLLAGRDDWPAARIILAIDLTDAVAREALARAADALVVYHPPIFKGITRVTPDAAAPTTLLPDLLAARISIIATHTALDAAPGGTNDVLLNALPVVERAPLELAWRDAAHYKLVAFVPPEQVDRLRAALAAAGAGRIGHYDECAFESPGRGSFRGDETTNPAVGRRQNLELVAESRLEMVVPRPRLGPVIRALYAAHTYEEPAFDIYPVAAAAQRGAAGMGRVGRLRDPLRGDAVMRRLAGILDLRAATVVGDLRRRFNSVTAAAGSFGVRSLRDPRSLVLTGELKHHDALDLLKRDITAVCVGHYASERPVLDMLQRRLRAALRSASVAIAKADRPPLAPLLDE